MVDEFPEQLQILPCKTEEEILDIVMFAFAEFQTIVGNKYSQPKLNSIRKKYRNRFLELANEICDTFYTLNPSVKLKIGEAIKIFLDFLKALHFNYENRELGSFNLNQMSSIFALEVFRISCTAKFGSLSGYLEALVPKKKERIIKLKRPAIQRTKFIERETGIKGLTEITFY